MVIQNDLFFNFIIIDTDTPFSRLSEPRRLQSIPPYKELKNTKTNNGSVKVKLRKMKKRMVHYSSLTLKLIMAIPLNLPVSGKYMQSTSVMVPQLSK